jgi:transcription elongation factor S-II
MSTILKKLKNSENKELLTEVNNIISKWKKILHAKTSNNNSEKKETQSKPKTNKAPESIKNSDDDFPKDYLLVNGPSRRNQVRKNMYKYFKMNLRDVSQEEINDLIEKIVKIEEILFEKFKNENSYTNRALEIISNVKDEKNYDFRDKIIKGQYKPEDLATMDVFEMVNKDKKKEIQQNIENNIDSVRSDWDEKHIPVTEGVYKCSKCGEKRTTQHEMQTRSADEPMTLFIRCVNCGNRWKK